ncbi:hypothetical protein AUQ43_08805 [Thalassospira sp. MCCC 1A01148]|uniref:Capsule polysaccharide biosynthesis protein n=2 Tax=Thalassospiraceae TaxID=2844866 RepID=A0A367VMC6_9PROT|nr:hypothetical protein AUQ43_08805 [Thalassospira sp. MCCC 1A01148]RCK25420.1 hypothetical protein TH6_02050 [Thalassospira profundimaris]
MPGRESIVFVDGSFANPLFWVRYALVRKAMGWDGSNEVLLLADYQQEVQKDSAANLGLQCSYDLLKNADIREVSYWTQSILQQLKSGVPVLNVDLPYDIPARMFYDYLLKKQTAAFVDISHPNIGAHIHDYVGYLVGAKKAFDVYEPEFVLSSHPDTICISFVWQALQRGVRVIVADSDFNTMRLWDVSNSVDVFDYGDRPSREDMDSVDEQRQQYLSKIGEAYLEKRFSGETDDIGAAFAYSERTKKVDRREICQTFGWDGQKPIVGIYASNWFDYPHTYGMSHFRDFHDWIMEVVKQAKAHPEFNWIFKAHPCDAWYGGVTLSDILGEIDLENTGIAHETWSGKSMIESVDGIVTYHGTIGVEASMLGVPVLVADRGWYHDWQFVVSSQSREDFLAKLGTDWWREFDIASATKRAKIFGGVFWGRPLWQKEFLLPDDAHGLENYEKLAVILETQVEALEAEAREIRQWVHSKYPHYHAWKMLNATQYTS